MRSLLGLLVLAVSLLLSNPAQAAQAPPAPERPALQATAAGQEAPELADWYRGYRIGRTVAFISVLTSGVSLVASVGVTGVFILAGTADTGEAIVLGILGGAVGVVAIGAHAAAQVGLGLGNAVAWAALRSAGSDQSFVLGAAGIACSAAGVGLVAIALANDSWQALALSGVMALAGTGLGTAQYFLARRSAGALERRVAVAAVPTLVDRRSPGLALAVQF